MWRGSRGRERVGAPYVDGRPVASLLQARLVMTHDGCTAMQWTEELMARGSSYDAIVIGAGPNGLAAAIVMARAGRSVLLREAAPTVGGGTRSAELTLPGFIHDICAAVHPLGIASPFFRTLPLDQFGLEWIQPPLPLAHPFDDGSAALLHRSVDTTAAGLGRDGAAYRRLMAPLVRLWSQLESSLLGPLAIPRHPLALARFGSAALLPADVLARLMFHDDPARGLFAGSAAHAIQPLEHPATGAFGLVLNILGHAVGWPIVRGGSQRLANALAAYLESLGGVIETGVRVDSIDELPSARHILFDLTPRQILHLAGDRLPPSYRRRLARYRYGPGVFKIDWALDGPIPWRNDACRRAGTIHLGGTLQEIALSERLMWHGEHPARPYVLLAQPSLFDDSRAPVGKHTAWAYCHVPHGSTFDMTERIEAQVERFAPGFRDLILARHTYTARAMERYNPNYIGGDINGGVLDLAQLWTRPTASLNPYRMPTDGLYICSSATPPGGGVHGLCGYFAAQAALRAA
jgi:phytoene dehydrogenase-like protein